MQVIKTNNWKLYIEAAFLEDSGIVPLYDKAVPVENTEAVCQNVFQKLASCEDDLQFYGVEMEGEEAGYFCFTEGVLLSFGLHPKHRQKEKLKSYFHILTTTIGKPFSCFLYSYNERAIRWLEKAGMKLIFSNVTLLQCQ